MCTLLRFLHENMCEILGAVMSISSGSLAAKQTKAVT